MQQQQTIVTPRSKQTRRRGGWRRIEAQPRKKRTVTNAPRALLGRVHAARAAAAATGGGGGGAVTPLLLLTAEGAARLYTGTKQHDTMSCSCLAVPCHLGLPCQG
jgi:hypothetical protein